MRQLAYGLVLILLAGCAQLGLTPARSFDDKAAYAYGTLIAVQQAAAQSLNAGTISSADATQVLKLADESKALLDAARAAAGAGDPSTAEGRLVLATQILTQLQAYLRGKTQ